MLPNELRSAIEQEIGAVQSVQRIGGGDVSSAARVETSAGPVFAKWGHGVAGQTYAAEADGLAALHALAGDELVVPTPIAFASWLAPTSGSVAWTPIPHGLAIGVPL